jgi:hypothetical protein
MEPEQARELLRAERERIEQALAKLGRADDSEPADEHEAASLAWDRYLGVQAAEPVAAMDLGGSRLVPIDSPTRRPSFLSKPWACSRRAFFVF